ESARLTEIGQAESSRAAELQETLMAETARAQELEQQLATSVAAEQELQSQVAESNRIADEARKEVENERNARVESEQRITEALEGRIQQLVESEREVEAAREAQRIEAEQRAAEMEEAEKRIEEARSVLEEARSRGENEREQREGLESRLRKLVEIAPAAPEQQETEDSERMNASALELAEQVATELGMTPPGQEDEPRSRFGRRRARRDEQPGEPMGERSEGDDDVDIPSDIAAQIEAIARAGESAKVDTGVEVEPEVARSPEVEARAGERAEQHSEESTGTEPQVEFAPEPSHAPVPQPVGVGANGTEHEHVARPSVFRRFGLGKRRKPFLEEPGRCAICGNSLKVDSDEEIEASGWQVSDDVGVCPDCQTDGWHLPEGSPLPVRQRSERGL
ncbi:MAG: hypothetical protein ACJ768_14635, partial [Gaiellaceae bacterium]